MLLQVHLCSLNATESTLLVAVKFFKQLSEDSQHSFAKECQLLSRLNHKNIVKLLAVTPSDSDINFMVVEYMEKGDLTQYLRQNKSSLRFPLSDTSGMRQERLI